MKLEGGDCSRWEQNSGCEGSIDMIMSTKGRRNVTAQASINSQSLCTRFCYFSQFSFYLFVSWSFYFQPWMKGQDKEFLSFFFLQLLSSDRIFESIDDFFGKEPCHTSAFPTFHLLSWHCILLLKRRDMTLMLSSHIWRGQYQNIPNFNEHIFGKYTVSNYFTSNTLPKRINNI